MAALVDVAAGPPEPSPVAPLGAPPSAPPSAPSSDLLIERGPARIRMPPAAQPSMPRSLTAFLHALSNLLLWGGVYMLLILHSTEQRDVASATLVCINCMFATLVMRVVKLRDHAMSICFGTSSIAAALTVHALQPTPNTTAVMQFCIAALNCLVMAAAMRW